MLGGSLLVGMDEGKEGLADEGVCLLLEMGCEDGIHVDELKVRGEKGPVWGERRGGVRTGNDRETIVRQRTTASFADFRHLGLAGGTGVWMIEGETWSGLDSGGDGGGLRGDVG